MLALQKMVWLFCRYSLAGSTGIMGNRITTIRCGNPTLCASRIRVRQKHPPPSFRLVRQRNVQEATERTRAFLGEVITQNAAAIRKQTEEIGDLYNEPVIAMDKLVQAHHDLLAALDLASRLREEGVITAKRNIEELTGMTRELSAHVHGLEDDEPGDRR